MFAEGGDIMQTLYVDVYFLINFSVDVLSLYFASRIVKIRTTVLRLMLGGILGSIVAIANVFINNAVVGYITLFLGFIAMMLVTVGGVGLYRRIKFAFCFSISEMLVGGFVYLLYDFLDGFLPKNSDAEGVQNRGLLLLSVIILISVGVFKCLISLFSFSMGSNVVNVCIEMRGNKMCAEALVDSGNMATDPLDMRSVMLVSSEISDELIGSRIRDLEDLSILPIDLRKRFRLIPVSFGGDTKILIGFRPDRVTVKQDKKEAAVDVTLAIDKDGGGYGGTRILMPAAAIRDVVT